MGVWFNTDEMKDQASTRVIGSKCNSLLNDDIWINQKYFHLLISMKVSSALSIFFHKPDLDV